MLELILLVSALIAVKHFVKCPPRSFTSAELPAIHQRELTRSEYRANARRYL